MSYLWIKIDKKEKDKFLLKCYKNKIEVFSSYEKDSFFYVKIKDSDYSKIKKFYFIKTSIVGEYGLNKVKTLGKKYHIFLFSFLIAIILFYFLSHIMVKVEVIHSNKEIRDLVSNALYTEGIRKNTWRKSFKELEKIKEKILEKYPNKIEWLEINVNGMNYEVRVEERKIKEEEKEKSSCNIVATKDGMVKRLIYAKGEAKAKVNDYVKKGDLLISGVLTKDEIPKGFVCARGSVYAEVWYEVTIKLPKEEQRINKTGKVRWNFKFKNNLWNDFILKSRLSNYVTEEKDLFTLFNTTFSFVKQYEVETTTYTFSMNELESLANKSLEEKIKETLKEQEKILDKKLLKKTESKEKMEFTYFVTVLEQIGEQQEFNIDNIIDKKE